MVRTSCRSRGKFTGLAIAIGLLAGCFNSATLNELSCTKDKYCPDGYVCIGAQIGTPGKCQKALDSGTPVSSTVDGSSAINDGSPIPVDVAIDIAPTSEAGSGKMAGAEDTGADKAPPLYSEVGTDVVPPYGADAPSDTPEATDLPNDFSAIPDLPVELPKDTSDAAPDLASC